MSKRKDGPVGKSDTFQTAEELAQPTRAAPDVSHDTTRVAKDAETADPKHHVGEVVTINLTGIGVRPAIVTRVHESGQVNLHVLKDIEDFACDAEPFQPAMGWVILPPKE